MFILVWGLLPVAAPRNRRKWFLDAVLFILLFRVVAEFHLRPVSERSLHDLLIFAFGIVMAQAVASIAPLIASRFSWTRAFGLRLLVASAVALSFVQIQVGGLSVFKGVSRESGVWRDPNMYGTYMAMALVATVGLLADSFRRDSSLRRWCLLWRVGLMIGAGIIAGACLRSYSRGAWLAAFFGTVFVVSASLRVFRRGVPRDDGRRRPTTRLGIALWGFVSLALVACVVGKQTDVFGISGTHSPFVTRLATVMDSNDLSWVNRVHAWSGGMKLLVDHPLFGIGLDEVAPAYAELYKPETVSSEAAIKTNAVTFLGAAMGLPLLIAIGALAFAGFSPASALASDRNAMLTATWQGIIIASLISHWFNGTLLTWLPGGLFWVAVAIGAGSGRHGPVNNAAGLDAQPRGHWCRRVVIGLFPPAILAILGFEMCGRITSPAFHVNDRLFLLGVCPRGKADAIAVVCAPGSETRTGFGGLPQMRDLGFATFAIYPTGSLPATAGDWIAAISHCTAVRPGDLSLPRMYVIFGAGSSAVCAELLGMASVSPTMLCWLDVNWKGSEGVNALEGVACALERRSPTAGLPSQVLLYCSPEEGAEVRSALAPIVDRLQRQGLSVLILGSIAASNEALRPLALREVAGQARAGFRLPTIHLPAREQPADFSLLVAAVRSVPLLGVAVALFWSSKRFAILRPGRRRLWVGIAGLTGLFVTCVTFRSLWPPLSRPTEWLGGPMVPPGLQDDYREVARSVDESKVTAAEVLAYVEISARQARRTYAELPKDIYREFLLQPNAAPPDGATIHFRLEMWRFLCGHIASSSDPVETARIVRQKLLNAVEIGSPSQDSLPLGEAWRLRMIPHSRLATLQITALRAAGVAARYRESRVEIWTGTRWQVATPLSTDSL